MFWCSHFLLSQFWAPARSQRRESLFRSVPTLKTLDPALNSAVDGGNMLITLFETLLIIDQDNKVQPGQAESYTVSPDGLTWSLHHA